MNRCAEPGNLVVEEAEENRREIVRRKNRREFTLAAWISGVINGLGVRERQVIV